MRREERSHCCKSRVEPLIGRDSDQTNSLRAPHLKDAEVVLLQVLHDDVHRLLGVQDRKPATEETLGLRNNNKKNLWSPPLPTELLNLRAYQIQL